MNKDVICTVKILKDCFCERSHGSPVRFSTGTMYRCRYELSLLKDSHLCFYVYDLDDFVYFPRASISWEEEKGK